MFDWVKLLRMLLSISWGIPQSMATFMEQFGFSMFLTIHYLYPMIYTLISSSYPLVGEVSVKFQLHPHDILRYIPSNHIKSLFSPHLLDDNHPFSPIMSTHHQPLNLRTSHDIAELGLWRVAGAAAARRLGVFHGFVRIWQVRNGLRNRYASPIF